jgi:Flp pilus assembly protein TadG
VGLATVHARRRRVRGMAMVEMVFVLPVLLLLVFSIAELSMMFSRWLTLISAVQEGARFASLYRPSCNSGSVATDATQVVQRYASGGGIVLPSGAVTVSGQCGPGGTTSSVVTASFNFAFQRLPDLSQWFPGFPGSWSVSSTATMMNE